MNKVRYVHSVVLGAMIACGGGSEACAVDYEQDIKPLLASKCTACHGPLDQEAGLRLDAGKLIHQGGEQGAAVVPGDSLASLLLERVATADVDERMPPEGEGEPLNNEQLALLKAWINDGAKFPSDEEVLDDPAEHWAYKVPVRAELPKVVDEQWSHPIDRFVASEHQKLGLDTVGVADRRVLLRRLYFDLIGLPPTRGQLQAFEADESPDAWSKAVDALLESPHHGERWGRHWMDVWRYSDWDGYKQELRGSQRHIWHWRDWIVDSLNADKGYDQMVLEMLAGDEIAPGDATVLSATGFLARNFHPSNRNMWLDATVEHTAKAFLGMTINCARCHGHKFDPIAQTAYYQMRAVFEPHKVRTDHVPDQLNLMKDGLPRVYDADLETETYLYHAGNEKNPDKENPLTAAVPSIVAGDFKVEPVELPVSAYYPTLQPYVVKAKLNYARAKLNKAQQAFEQATAVGEKGEQPKKAADVRLLELKATAADMEMQSLEARLAADRMKYEVGGAEENSGSLEELAMLAASAERKFNVGQAVASVREKEKALQAAETSEEKADKKKKAVAEAKKQLDEAWKKLTEAQSALAKTDGEYTGVGTEYPRKSSGRRTALARWMVDRKNPLTARVAVNHIWLHHFGVPLVDNTFDFGLRSPRPRHAALLDWLAVELIENNWSMKHLHRLILSSRTWQLQSSGGEVAAKNLEIDRDNHFLWRMNVRRLESEVVRDNMLAVSEQLDPTFGGAEIAFAEGEKTKRRSLYLQHAYEKQMSMMVQFDAASPNECYRRSESVVPQQALALTNSSLSLGQARLLAKKLWEEVAPAAEEAAQGFVRAAFLQVLSRPPADEEARASLEFLVEQATLLADTDKLSTFAGGGEAIVKPADDPRQRARENFVHVLLNHNDFVTVR